MADTEKTNHIVSLSDLALRYRYLVSQQKFNEATTLILSFFYRKILIKNDRVKAVKYYNKIANKWNLENDLKLPQNFVYDAFMEEVTNGTSKVDRIASEASGS